MSDKHVHDSRPQAEDLPPFDEVMERLAELAGVKNQSALARELHLTPASVSDAKKRGPFPLAWALSLARSLGVSLDLILGLKDAKKPCDDGPSSAAWGMTEPERVRHLRLDEQPQQPQVELVYVDKVRARVSAGTGSLEVDPDPVGRYAFRRDWITLKGAPGRMVLMDVVGDSMEPEIKHGDVVLIDQSQTDVIGGAIYAVGVEDTVYVKRVDRLPGKLSLGSINPAYAPIEINMRGDLAETVRIIGRVIWWCREAR